MVFLSLVVVNGLGSLQACRYNLRMSIVRFISAALFMSVLCFPAFAQDQVPIMPREFLGRWNDKDLNDSMEIWADEIVYKSERSGKMIEDCRYKYKTVRVFPEKREIYLMAAWICPERSVKPVKYDYKKISDTSDKADSHYQTIRIFNNDCGLNKRDWDNFNPDSSWKDINGTSKQCYRHFPQEGFYDSWPYWRER